MSRLFFPYKKSWLSLSLLFLLAFLYCLPAYRAPFWGSGDAWSNLLPIVHYRYSLLEEHRLPLYTELWYGGRYQWQNPLWNFLYPPATLVWLVFPLDVGTRLVFLGHLWFSLFAAYLLSKSFLQGEMARSAMAILLTAPVLAAYYPSHTEKILAWGWVLLAVYFLLHPSLAPLRRGVLSGLCVGVIPLTGSNYYAFYALLLMGCLLGAVWDRKVVIGFVAGASLGLLHMPSVWYLVGQARGSPAEPPSSLAISLAGMISSLAFGVTLPLTWESWAPIGLPTLYLTFKQVANKLRSRQPPTRLEIALLVSGLIFVLLATGVLYRGHALLDTFRVPMRALPFIALSLLLGLLVQTDAVKKKMTFFLVVAAIQVSLTSLLIRPSGSPYSPYDPQAQAFADTLKRYGVRQVWLPSNDLREMFLHVSLNRNGIGLPNVYYGDMGQEPAIEGEHCGYGFDHLLTRQPIRTPGYYLKPDFWRTTSRGWIEREQLRFVASLSLYERQFTLYRVVCEQEEWGGLD